MFERFYPQASLAADIAAEHNRNVHEIRHIAGPRAEQYVCRAYCEPVDTAAEDNKPICKAPDLWSDAEESGIDHVVHTLDILRTAFAPFDIGTSNAHATIRIQDQEVEVIGVLGKSHDDCLRHTETIFPTRGHKMLVVSRDRDNNEFLSRFGSFMKQKTELQGEAQFTDLASNKVVVGYRSLLSSYQNSQTRQQLGESLYASFNSS
jgi:hypothetical protein